jgi:hypothetical protein
MLTFDAVVVDWVEDFPMKRLCFRGGVVVNFFQAAIGNRHQVFRNSHVDSHSAIRLVVPDIFVRPPNARANSLAGSVDEVFPEIIAAPTNAANPRRIRSHRGNAFVGYVDLIFNAFRNLLLKSYPIDVPFPFKFEFGAAMNDFRNCKRRL